MAARALDGAVPAYRSNRGQPDGKAFASGFARQAIRRANDTCAIKGITPHRLPGRFATLMSEACVPIQTVQRVMRHKSFTTTMGYLDKNWM